MDSCRYSGFSWTKILKEYIMNDFRERSNPWSSDINSSEPTDRDAPWRNVGTSMGAISFVFVATEILVSMFLIMAIFEHLVRRRPSFLLSRDVRQLSSETHRRQNQMDLSNKLGSSQDGMSQYPSCDVSVLMPGQKYPTYIAQPAPLPSCPREGIYWPSHDNHNLPLS